MQESGAGIAGAQGWADSLVMRFNMDSRPSRTRYVVGDTDRAGGAQPDPSNGALIAAIAGPASEKPRAWARRLEADLG
jgi:hypothetical protein